MAKRVVVAMSGGVDSSVALALLKEEGYDCVGVSMQLWDYSQKEDSQGALVGSCCSMDDLYDARRVADSLGVPFYVVNVEKVFSKEVVDYFVDAYSRGETPNPCVKCNEVLKFDTLLKKALSIEADFLATGHYARIERRGDRYALLKGADPDKDQSYFLFTMTQEQLRRVLFPVGHLTKKEVRAHARRLNLKTSDKKESQEICFTGDERYDSFLAQRIKPSSGDIVDIDGKKLGMHDGLYRYTIGQRKGLGLSGGPYYVVSIDVSSNTLVVGRGDSLLTGSFCVRDVNWMDEGVKARLLKGELGQVSVKVRYRHEGVASSLEHAPGNRVRVVLSEPQRAITPGQAAVFYTGDEVVGGGWIDGQN